MSQCLRCNKPCSATSIFCNECRLLVQNTMPQNNFASNDVSRLPTSQQIALSASLGEVGGMQGDGVQEEVLPPNSVLEAPQTPPVAFQNNMSDQVLNKMNDAAKRIEAAEPGDRRHKPRVSRLSPLRDISGEIRRGNTPLPPSNSSSPGDRIEDLSTNLPELWPWLLDADGDELEVDAWGNRTDPLKARRFPKSRDVALLEEEDMRRAMADGTALAPPKPVNRRNQMMSRLRVAFVSLAILAFLALTIDSLLLTNAFHRRNQNSTNSPVLTLSKTEVAYGDDVILRISNFPPAAKVYITHDIQETVQIKDNGSLITVSNEGNYDAHLIVPSNWNPGYHTLEAEDTATHYTANAMLHINSGPTRPAHLVVNPTSLDLGPAPQGSNTIQPLTLQNSGSGAIRWSASSNQPWLMVSPNQGVFSDKEVITIAGERSGLQPGSDYHGTVTFSSTMGESVTVDVQMEVRSLENVNSAVLDVTPPVLSFITVDGDNNPDAQFLQINNPGSKPLHWSLDNMTVTQNPFLNASGLGNDWLHTDPQKDVVPPHGTAFVRVFVQSSGLLPGAYMETLKFGAGEGALNSPQSVSVSLTVQPRCSVALSSGMLSFVAVTNKGRPNNQVLSFGSTTSCPGSLPWTATTSVNGGGKNWLSVTPSSGTLNGSNATATMTVSVDPSNLAVGTYTGSISIMTRGSTQSAMVTLQVQPEPAPDAPTLSVSPTNFTLPIVVGQPNPPPLSIVVRNSGGGTLHWSISAMQQGSNWYDVGPTGGALNAGQSGSLGVYITSTNLRPSTTPYAIKVTVSGTDDAGNSVSGSPQEVLVSVMISAPCGLSQPSAGSLAFNAVQGGGDPTPQQEILTVSGSCAWPLNWGASVSSSASWLRVTPSSGSFTGTGQSTTLSVAPSIANLAPGNYNAQVSLTATDNTNTAQGHTQTFSVSLTVLPPCSLQASVGHLSFSVAQGQTTSAQSVSLAATASCKPPVSWSASADSNWLALSPSSGSDNGNGSSLGVSVNASKLAPGNYSGTITLSAGSGVQANPQSISVAVTVTGFTLSGAVRECTDTTCSSTKAFSGATVNLLDGAGKTVTSATCDATGNYSLSNVGLGTYTVSAGGTDGGVHYAGSKSVTISGDQSGLIVNAPPG